jgi:hypothetical protein
MIEVSHRPDIRPREANMAPAIDPRTTVFCSTELPHLFHAVANRSDVWKPDPFDVESIHEEARAAFVRLVHRASDPEGASSGRILLLLGEAGSGKTHLMRAYRNWAHGGQRGYCGYMQMTTSTPHYGRYVLNNLIDSLDHPYDERRGETTALMRLSTALAQCSRGVSLSRIEQLRDGDLDYGCLAKLIEALADQIVMDERFNSIDHDLVRALLFLQSQDPRIKGRVVKYLRCEDLSDYDRRILGGMVPRTYEDAPQRLIQRLGELMWATESAPLLLFVDQIEDIFNLDDAGQRFRRVLATLSDVVSGTPSSVVVIACLEDYYQRLRDSITAPLRDRIERDPRPITLKALRSQDEITALVSLRLRHLFEAREIGGREDQSTFPFPAELLEALSGLSTRQVLNRCQEYREECMAAGRLVGTQGRPSNGMRTEVPPATTSLEQAWNDARTSFTGDVPVDEAELAALLAASIVACSVELETGSRFVAEAVGNRVAVECHSADNTVCRLMIGLCNQNPQGGRLGRQIEDLIGHAGEQTPVIVRSTDFPSNPATQIYKRLGEVVAHGGKRVVIEDSEWRAMLAMRRFRESRRADPALPAWLREGRPLTRLHALRTILDINGLVPAAVVPPSPAPPQPAELSPAPPIHAVPVRVGTTNDRAQSPVLLDREELTRHAAFLGGTGSGKTTVALNVVEQLLVQGVPSVLVDRKGDLCGYARERTWTGASDNAGFLSRRGALHERADIALYTPGNPHGRPLSIAITPGGMGRMGSFEREQLARFAASALAGMMNYGSRGTDTARQAILAQAIDLLTQLEPEGSVTLPGLVEFIHSAEPSLLNAVGKLDTKLFEKLVQDLETLRLTKGEFLAARGEPLEAEALLGLGRHARPGKTRLSVISTKFLGETADVQFWVAHFLVELRRWASRSPSERLQAVVLFDEADLYLPAQRQPPAKEPMEDLIKRARSAGLGILLATQSPGDFDYKSRDNIRTWFVGRVKEPTALAKMKPMLSECRVEVASRLPTQETGEFHLVRDGSVTSLRAERSVLETAQVPEDEILALARASVL